MNYNRTITSLLNGILPALVVVIAFAILAPVLRAIARQRKLTTYSALDIAVRVGLLGLAR